MKDIRQALQERKIFNNALQKKYDSLKEYSEEELKNAKIIVADPLYRPICPKDSPFYEIPHVAFSGRIYF